MADEQGHARSQFFLTLSPARWLDGAHSIFGSVVGDTIFNVLALAAHPVDAFDDPAVMLKGVSVESNPFPDIVALPAPESAQETTNIAAARSHPVSAKRAVKSRGRLSFAESDSEGEENHGALFRPPKSTRQVSLRPPAAPHAEATSSGGDKHGKECPNKLGERTVKQGLNNSANIIREAEAEFERLKARHVVATRHSHNNNNNNNAHKAEERDQVKKEQQEEGNVEAQTGVISKKRLGDRSRKATSRRDEGETLRRLRAFEGRIVRARRDARTANAKPGKSVEHGVSPQNHWFATRLRLVTDAMVEEDDYEVRFGTKKT